MKKLILCILPVVASLTLLIGCATDQVTAVDETINGLRPVVQPLVAAVMQMGIDYGAKQAKMTPEDKAALKVQINSIADKIARSSALASSAASNAMTPDEFATLLKVKDPNVTQILQTLLPTYKMYYNQWQQDPRNLKIFAYSRCVLDGLSLLAGSLDQATD